jgi:hypothetical protein
VVGTTSSPPSDPRFYVWKSVHTVHTIYMWGTHGTRYTRVHTIRYTRYTWYTRYTRYTRYTQTWSIPVVAMPIKQTLDGITALHVTAQYGHVAAVRCLLQECGADPTVISSEDPQSPHRGLGFTPLHLAAEAGHLPVLRELLKPKFDIYIDHFANLGCRTH